MVVPTDRHLKPHLRMDIHHNLKKSTRSVLIRDRHLEDVGVLWNKYRHLMKEALREDLESIVPPPFLAHTNDGTVPPAITLG
eukprot:12758728-Prorocentrum_lima.AAC.1